MSDNSGTGRRSFIKGIVAGASLPGFLRWPRHKLNAARQRATRRTHPLSTNLFRAPTCDDCVSARRHRHRQHQPGWARAASRLGDLQSARQRPLAKLRIPFHLGQARQLQARGASAGSATDAALCRLFRAWFGQRSGVEQTCGATFTGEFPMARIAFTMRSLPVHVTLEAFSPFIPLDPDASGLPVAILRYRVHNPGPGAAQVSIAFSIDSPVGTLHPSGDGRTNEFRVAGAGASLQGLYMTNPQLKEADPLQRFVRTLRAGTRAMAE